MTAAKPPSQEPENTPTEESFSLFIFKLGPQSMKSAEAYLRNRKWTVGSASGMREAIAYIIQYKPQFVMVAADHPNKKVKNFPKLISQAFPAKVIAFAEGSGTNAMNALREMALRHTLFPPVSGPAIERLVRKILKEQKTEADRQDKLLTQMEKNDNANQSSQQNIKDSEEAENTFRLKSESTTAQEMQGSFEQAREALSQLVGGMSGGMSGGEVNDGTSNGTNENNKTGAAYVPTHENAGPTTPGYYIARGTAENATPSSTQEQTPDQNNSSITQKGINADLLSAHQKGPHAEDLAAHQKGPAATSYNAQQKGPDGRPLAYHPLPPNSTPGTPFTTETEKPDTETSDWTALQAPPTPESSDSTDASATSHDENVPPPLERSQDSAAEKSVKTKTLYIRGTETELSKADSLIIRGSVEAMDETLNQGIAESPQSEALTSSGNTYCLAIKSPRFSGYLVTALKKNRTVDQAFITTVKQRLFAFLEANGEAAADENPMDIKINEVAFEGWAIEQAEFLRKSIHNGEEFAMAFFPNKNMSTRLEDSANEKMVKMRLDELQEDIALEFDIYLYMPENKKYLLYTPQGKNLQGQQKSRLLEKGLTHMHLRRDSIGDVKKFRAQNFLNSKIEAYKTAALARAKN